MTFRSGADTINACDIPYDLLLLLLLLEGEPRFGTNDPARQEWYHVFIENRCFTGWVRILEAHTTIPPPIHLPILQRPATHVWRVWCCGCAWADVIVNHQAKRIHVCLIFRKIKLFLFWFLSMHDCAIHFSEKSYSLRFCWNEPQFWVKII